MLSSLIHPFSFMNRLSFFSPSSLSLVFASCRPPYPFPRSHFNARASFSISSRIMSQEFKLKDVSSLQGLGEKTEVEVEGVEGGKVLLVNTGGKVHAVGPKCTHYGAPLKNGVVASDGRLTCPWHGACFSVHTGDVEDAPALDPIARFDLTEKNGGVYIKGDADLIKAGRKQLPIQCSAQGSDQVVIVGGGSGAVGAMEELRKCGFKGHITVLSAESDKPYDRTKLSKALISDISKIAWRTPEFYKSSSIDIHQTEVTSVDFNAKAVKTRDGKSYPYTKLILATGGAPKSLPLQGLREGELGNVFLLRNIQHTQAITAALGQDSPKRIVVVGASFIGLEVANALASQKHDVTVVGMESAPAEAVFGTKLGNVFRAMLEKNGVKFQMNAAVSHAEPNSSDKSKVGSVHLKDGKSFPADIVIEGVGVGPATNFVKDSPGAPSLQKDGSLLVDETFAVQNLQDVYAVGDIAMYPFAGHNVRIEHWNVAQNAGRTAARTIAKPNEKSKPFVPVFWSALGSQLRYCGHPVNGYDDVIIDGNTDVSGDKQPSFAAYFTKQDQVVAVATMGKDPVMVQSAELMRRGAMLSASDIKSGRDVLSVNL